MDARIRVQYLSGFEDLFQTPQIAGDLLARLFTEQLGERSADGATGRFVLQLDLNLRASLTRCLLEAHDTATGYAGGTLDGSPRQALAGAIHDDFRIPRNRNAGRAL